MKKFFVALLLTLSLAFPAQAGWKTKALGLGFAYAARNAPPACAASPACMAAVQRTALALTKKYGEAAVKGCFNSPKCLGLLAGTAVGVVGEHNKEALSEWFNSYMGKGKSRDYRNGKAPGKDGNNEREPEPNDEQEVHTLQAGGNTLSDRTAKALNRVTNKNLQKRDWGRALESLKKENTLLNDHHGVIRSDGAYIDTNGNFVGYLKDYLF
jgi:hypothetical protein